MQTISTPEAAALINRSRYNAADHLRRRGVKPVEKSPGGYRWSRADVEALVEQTPELQEPFRANAAFNNGIALGPKRNLAKSEREWAIVCATAAARMAAGIRVGEKERYGEIPELTIDDVPDQIWYELDNSKKKTSEVIEMPRGIRNQKEENRKVESELFMNFEIGVEPPRPGIRGKYADLEKIVLGVELNGSGKSEWMRFLFPERKLAVSAQSHLRKRSREEWKKAGHDVEMQISVNEAGAWLYVRRKKHEPKE